LTVFIGTSGWHYKDWRGRFYPPKLATGDWLPFYAERFATVEVNNAFYRLPQAGTFAHWAQETPGDFVVAVKASRYLTHIKRLREPEEPVQRLLGRAGELGGRLGPVLLQLPPNMKKDRRLLSEALQAFPAGVRVAVEVRDPRWCNDEIRSVLEEHGAAWCLADGGPIEIPRWRTADWLYVRFHRGNGQPPPCYTRSPLETWARRLAGLCQPETDVYCYFNNDPHGCAPHDARRFAAAVRRAGLVPTRVPGVRETPLA
jgi:uncharacterized protein YecE (DUF72 family)